jgi:hypothetical protein
MAPPINEGPPGAPEYRDPLVTGGNIARRVVAVLLCLLMMAVLAISALLHAAYTVVGTPAGASDAFVAVVTSNSVAPVIAVAALKDISAKSPAPVQQVIAANTASLEAVIVTTIHSSAVQTQLRSDMNVAYRDFTSGTGGDVNLAPLVGLFTTQLHAANPDIPASPAALNANLVLTIQPRPKVKVGSGLNLWAWILTAVGLLGTVLIARFLIRHKNIQLLAVGLVIGIPGIVLLSAGHAANRTNWHHYTSATGQIILVNTVHHIGSVVADQGLVLIVAAAAIIVIWIGIRLVRHSPSPSAATPAGA